MAACATTFDILSGPEPTLSLSPSSVCVQPPDGKCRVKTRTACHDPIQKENYLALFNVGIKVFAWSDTKDDWTDLHND